MAKKTPKKRNKKYNANKPDAKYDFFAKQHVIASLSGDKNVGAFLANGNDRMNTSVGFADTLNEYRHNWHVCMAVILRNNFGKNYMQTISVNVVNPCYVDELSVILENEHEKLLDTVNPQHFCQLGWVASPIPREWDDAVVARIFDKMGAWDDHLAQWQVEK